MNDWCRKNIVLSILITAALCVIFVMVSSRIYTDNMDLRMKDEIQIEVISKFDTINFKLDKMIPE